MRPARRPSGLSGFPCACALSLGGVPQRLALCLDGKLRGGRPIGFQLGGNGPGGALAAQRCHPQGKVHVGEAKGIVGKELVQGRGVGFGDGVDSPMGFAERPRTGGAS